MLPIIHLGSSIQIPSYYLVISAVVILCLIWLSRRTIEKNLSYKISLDLSLIIMVSGFIGARLLHVFYENFEYYRIEPQRIFYFWDGGFVFYGGALVSGFFGFIFLKRKVGKELTTYLDLFAPVLSLGYALGRIGCLLAGCCYGRFCDLPWALNQRHPTQAYAILWEAGVVMILLGLESVKPEHRYGQVFKKSGSLFYTWMILHGMGRFIMESFRDDFRGPVWGLSISSWISLVIILLGCFFLWRQARPTQGRST